MAQAEGSGGVRTVLALCSVVRLRERGDVFWGLSRNSASSSLIAARPLPTANRTISASSISSSLGCVRKGGPSCSVVSEVARWLVARVCGLAAGLCVAAIIAETREMRV
jgi:hypothetical protein